jgi:hypothetical protein
MALGKQTLGRHKNEKTALEEFKEVLGRLPLDRAQRTALLAKFTTLPEAKVRQRTHELNEALAGLEKAGHDFRALEAKARKEQMGTPNYWHLWGTDAVTQPEVEIRAEVEALQRAVAAS